MELGWGWTAERQLRINGSEQVRVRAAGSGSGPGCLESFFSDPGEFISSLQTPHGSTSLMPESLGEGEIWKDCPKSAPGRSALKYLLESAPRLP